MYSFCEVVGGFNNKLQVRIFIQKQVGNLDLEKTKNSASTRQP